MSEPVENDENRGKNSGHPSSGQLPGGEVEGAEEESLDGKNGFDVKQNR